MNLPNLDGDWVDFVILLILIYFASEAFRHGVWVILAVIPALGEGIVLIAFILTLVIGLPVRPSIKNDVSDSKIGSFILKQTSGAEKFVNEIFGGVIEDSLTY